MRRLASISLFIVLGVVAAATTTPCLAQNPPAAAQTSERSDWLTKFDGVDIRTDAEVRFVAVADSVAPRIVYDTKGSTATKFTYEIKDRTLRVSEKIDSNRKDRTSVTIYHHAVSYIKLSDASVLFADTLRVPMLDITVGAGARLAATLDVGDLLMDLSGESSATMTGRVRYLNLQASTGRVEAANLEVMSAIVNSQSKAEVRIKVTDRLEAKTSTGGMIRYGGTPPLIRQASKFFGGDIKPVQ